MSLFWLLLYYRVTLHGGAKNSGSDQQHTPVITPQSFIDDENGEMIGSKQIKRWRQTDVCLQHEATCLIASRDTFQSIRERLVR